MMQTYHHFSNWQSNITSSRAYILSMMATVGQGGKWEEWVIHIHRGIEISAKETLFVDQQLFEQLRD